MEKKDIKLSVAIAVFNEEKAITRCLDSVSEIADEIVVVDGGSSDKTADLSEAKDACVIRTDNPAMFHINKQKALDACHGEWILQLDADEVVTPELQKKIISLISSGQTSVNGYFIPRRNYFWGHFMKKGGQYPDYVIRLVRRGKAHFPCKSVHEQIEIDGKTGYISEPMLHFSYMTRRDYWKKADTYTSLTASEIRTKAGNPAGKFLHYLFLKPFVTFLTLFFRHKGFSDGLTGFEFSLYSALHFPWAYMKSLSRQ